MRLSSLERMRSELLKAHKVEPFHDWVMEKGIYLKQGVPFSFAGHLPLKAIYRDEHPYITIRKAVQLGVSTYAILRMLWTADALSGKGIYFATKDKFFERFTPDRVNKIIKSSPYLSRLLGETDNVHFKEFANASFYLYGLESKDNTDSVDADFIVIDEVDHVNQENMEFALDRLEHSTLGAVLQLSKPTIPGYGIDAEFMLTDQRYWLMKCPRCSHYSDVVERFSLDEPERLFKKVIRGVNRGGVFMRCEKCDGNLDPEQGEWVAACPSVEDRRGYHLSQLYFGFKPAGYKSQAAKVYAKIKAAKTTLKRKRVMQSHMGLAFAGSDQRVTDAVLDRLHGAYIWIPAYKGWSYMGCDQGDLLYPLIGHMIGERMEIHHAEICDSFRRLDELMKIHHVWNACLELRPNAHSAKNFALRCKRLNLGGVVLVEVLSIDDDVREKSIEKENTTLPLLRVDREENMDATIDWLEFEKFALPRRSAGGNIEVLRSHFKKLIKIEVETAKKQKKKVFQKHVENHFAFSGNLLRLAYLYRNLGRPAVNLGLLPAGASLYGGKGGERVH